jgi:hypothetical protein
MQNGRMTNMNARQSRPAAPFAGRSARWSSNGARPQAKGTHNARSSYERYLALAQGEARAGNTIAAENYYQHAEHYFRLMSSDREGM